MKTLFFDSQPYTKTFLKHYDTAENPFVFVKESLTPQTAKMAAGYDAVAAFVNSDGSAATLRVLHALGVKFWFQRSAGYERVDLKAAAQYQIRVFNVPGYSPESVAEHAVTLLMAANRQLKTAVQRVKQGLFTLNALQSERIGGATVGVLGVGRIGQIFVRIINGFGVKVLVYDEYAAQHNPTLALKLDFTYVTLDEVLRKSDYISLHLPLYPATHHIINSVAVSKMKKGVVLVNTSRGGLVDSTALLKGIEDNIIRGAGIDVYENEALYFFKDFPYGVKDPVLQALINNPKVLVTPHQAFFTTESLKEIALSTVKSIKAVAANTKNIFAEITTFTEAPKSKKTIKESKS